MKTYGLIAKGNAIPNVTVTTSVTEKDVSIGNRLSMKKGPTGDKETRQSVELTARRSLQKRLVRQGASEVRIFPVA